MRKDNEEELKFKQTIHKKEVVLLVVIFCFIAVFASVFYGKSRHAGDKVIVKIDNEICYEYDLNETQEVFIAVDEEATNTLLIKNGEADMIDANCPDHLCVNMKAISKDGESIVCLPHKLIVEIQSEENQSELDTMAQ